MPTKFVRVRDKGTGHESTVSLTRLKQLGDGVETLDEPAVDGFGRPLPSRPAPKTTKAAAVAAKSKEQAR